MSNSIVVRKKDSLFQKIIDYFKLSHDNKQAQSTIEEFRGHSKFSADKSEFVKYASHYLCKKSPDMCVFFADCDNLRIANEVADFRAAEINAGDARAKELTDINLFSNPITGEEIVDTAIESILQQLKLVNQKYGYSDALLGIQGDEIFISIPHMKPEDISKVYDEYSQAHSGLITISVGYCNDMSHGVEAAFNHAEEQSQTVKNRKKEKTRQSVFGENSHEILASELKNMLSQLRIDVDNLTNHQRLIFRDTVKSSFEDSIRTPQGIAEDVRKILAMPHEDNLISQRISFLEKQLDATYSSSISSEKAENYVLSQILKEVAVPGVQKLDYFIHKGSESLLSPSKQKTNQKLQNEVLISFEFSGIKDINDTFGHAKCDQMVYDCIKDIQTLVKEMGIKTDSPLIARGISSYGILVNTKELEKFPILQEKIANISKDFKLAACATRLGSEINEDAFCKILKSDFTTSTDVLQFLFNSASKQNRMQNKRANSVQKINDKEPISRYISKNLVRIQRVLGQDLTPELISTALTHVLHLDENIPKQINTQNLELSKPPSSHSSIEKEEK